MKTMKSISKWDKTKLGIFCLFISCVAPTAFAETLHVTSCVGETLGPEKTVAVSFSDVRLNQSIQMQFALIFDSEVNGGIDQLSNSNEILRFNPLMRPTSQSQNLVVYHSQSRTTPAERRARNASKTQQIIRPANDIQNQIGESRKTLREIFKNMLLDYRYKPEAAVECGGNEELTSRAYRQRYKISYSATEVEPNRTEIEVDMNCSRFDIESEKISNFIFCTHMKSNEIRAEEEGAPTETEEAGASDE